jgi:uncharacterized protein (TIGR03435 family)
MLALVIGLGPALGTCRGAASDAPAFEVASIKLSRPLDETRRLLFDAIRETADLASLPGPHNRVDIRNATLAQLIAMAYRIRPRMIVGPSWLSDTRFEVIATIPSGHRQQEGPEMLQTLLEERFALRSHRDARTMSGYILSVRKGGPGSPWQKSSRIGNAGETAGETACATIANQQFCGAGGAGIQPAGTSATGC